MKLDPLYLSMVLWDDEFNGGGDNPSVYPRTRGHLGDYVEDDLWTRDWGQPGRPATRRQTAQVEHLVSSLAATVQELSS